MRTSWPRSVRSRTGRRPGRTCSSRTFTGFQETDRKRHRTRAKQIRERSMTTRRALAALPFALAASFGAFPAAAQSEIKVAVIAPMSGPWARQGDLMLKGANLAIEHINAAGGIKAMNGARMKLLTFDAGDTVEKAKNAAQRMIAQEPDLVGVTGAWLSSFTLGVTEVTERAELPILTLSYSDALTARGFKYIFQTSMPGGAQAVSAMPAILKLAEAATGKKPATVG